MSHVKQQQICAAGRKSLSKPSGWPRRWPARPHSTRNPSFLASLLPLATARRSPRSSRSGPVSRMRPVALTGVDAALHPSGWARLLCRAAARRADAPTLAAAPPRSSHLKLLVSNQESRMASSLASGDARALLWSDSSVLQLKAEKAVGALLAVGYTLEAAQPLGGGKRSFSNCLPGRKPPTPARSIRSGPIRALTTGRGWHISSSARFWARRSCRRPRKRISTRSAPPTRRRAWPIICNSSRCSRSHRRWRARHPFGLPRSSPGSRWRFRLVAGR